MNKKMLAYYSAELNYLREMGQEFADNYPKVAARLGLDSFGTPDPYVERLLEGVSFLTARTKLKIDAEYPNFVRRILEVVHPQFLYPIPSVAIVSMSPSNLHLNTVQKIKRSQVFESLPIKLSNQEVSCKFAATRNAEVTPAVIDSIRYSSSIDHIPAHLLLEKNVSNRSVLKVDFSISTGSKCSDVVPGDLNIYLGNDISISSQLLFLLEKCCTHVFCHSSDHSEWFYKIDLPEQMGFGEDESMIFDNDSSIPALRLLQEYIHLPEKFTFINQRGIKSALIKAEKNNHIDVVARQLEKIVAADGVNKRVIGYEERKFSLSFVFDTFIPELQHNINENTLMLNALPVVNLFKKKNIRFPINSKEHRHHILVDRTQPLNYEVHNIVSVKAFDSQNNILTDFKPAYQPTQVGIFPSVDIANSSYYSIDRTARSYSETVKKYGSRTSYLGGEVFVSIATQNNSVFDVDIRQLAVEAWCTNRDLPLILSRSKESDFLIDNSLPISAMNFIIQPTKPKESIVDDTSIWSLLNLLSFNYGSFQNLSSSQAAMYLQELLLSLPFSSDSDMRTQIESIKNLTIKPIKKVMRNKGASSLVNGTHVEIELDESLLGGIHPYLFSSILRYFFLRSISINSYLEMSVSSIQKGQIINWQSSSGNKVML